MSTVIRPVALQPAEGRWLSWFGNPLRYVATAEDTGGTYCLSWGQTTPGDSPPFHRHSFEEGFYVLRGEYEFRCGNQSVHLRQGDFINIRGGASHSLKCIGNEAGELLVIAAPAGFDRFQMEIGKPANGPDGPFEPQDRALLGSMNEFAAGFGIDLAPPASARDESMNATIRRAGEGLVIDAGGDRYRFLVEADETSGKYALWHATVPTGGGPPPHIHSREEEGFYIIDGEVTFYSDDLAVRLTAGSYVQVKKHSLHWFRNESEQTAHMLVLVAPGGMEQMFRATGSLVRDPVTTIGQMTDEQKSALLRLAPEFGIQIIPPKGH